MAVVLSRHPVTWYHKTAFLRFMWIENLWRISCETCLCPQLEFLATYFFSPIAEDFAKNIIFSLRKYTGCKGCRTNTQLTFNDLTSDCITRFIGQGSGISFFWSQVVDVVNKPHQKGIAFFKFYHSVVPPYGFAKRQNPRRLLRCVQRLSLDQMMSVVIWEAERFFSPYPSNERISGSHISKLIQS